MGKLLVLVTLVSMGSVGHAEIYNYSATAIRCTVEARRQTLTEPIAQIGKGYEMNYAFQLFKSRPGAYTPRFTAFSELSNPAEIAGFIASGGLPNSVAQQNWTVPQNQVSIQALFGVRGAFGGQINFAPIEAGGSLRYDVVGAHFSIPWTLAVAQKILIALGDINTPNFPLDPPVSNFSGRAIEFDMFSDALGWVTNVGALRYENSHGIYGYQEVQLHYPADRHNGLSYHIKLRCDSLTDVP